MYLECGVDGITDHGQIGKQDGVRGRELLKKIVLPFVRPELNSFGTASEISWSNTTTRQTQTRIDLDKQMTSCHKHAQDLKISDKLPLHKQEPS